MELAVGILVAAVALGTGAVAVAKRGGPEQGELFRIRETPMTAAMGLALWVEAFFLLYVLLTRPDQLAPSVRSRINAYLFLVVSAVLGGAMILYSFVKKILVFDDRVTYVSALGQRKTLRWDEIDEVRVTQTKRLTLLKKGGVQFTVGGRTEAYRRFIKFASKKVPPEAGEDVLAGLKTALKL